MTIRDILVQMDERPAAILRAKTAAHFAARHGARLTGVFLKSDFLRLHGGSETIGFLSPAQFDAILQEQAEAVQKVETVARAAFETAVRQTGVLADWRPIESDRADPLVSLARQFDLTILPASLTACLGQYPISAAQIAMATGGPTVILPDDGYVAGIGRKILVAWKNTRESARALRDAMPILAAAEKVTVLVVPDDEDAFVGGDLERHFGLHHCEFELVIDRRRDLTTTGIIRHHAEQIGADLLVAGLYGRPRVQEIVLGGVSRNLLQAPPAPLFVSH